jgi:hypothetical protein
MFEKYMICTREFGNVSKNGQITGFQLNIRINYYRGVYLSQVDTLKLVVDGEEFPAEKMTFTVPEHGPNIPSTRKTYTFEELGKATKTRWFFGDLMTLTVPKPGGLSSGMHKIQLGLFVRNSYVPRFDKEQLFDFFGSHPDGATHYGEPPARLSLVTKNVSLVQ